MAVVLPWLGQFFWGALVVFGVAAVALVLTIVWGLLGAAAKLSGNRVAAAIADGYTTVFRGTPELLVLLIIYFGEGPTVYIAATIVAFFPILSNTMTGLRSTDHGLVNLFELYGAGPVQRLTVLQLPNALPYFLTGLRIASGLALIGAIVAEFVAGSAGKGSGLAFRIVESGYRLNIPRMFAALILISLAGVLLYFSFAWLSHPPRPRLPGAVLPAAAGLHAALQPSGVDRRHGARGEQPLRRRALAERGGRARLLARWPGGNGPRFSARGPGVRRRHRRRRPVPDLRGTPGAARVQGPPL